MRTIIVDDEEYMLKSFLRQSADIEEINVIATFEDAEDAIEFSKSEIYELAVLDISMPGMTGIELAQKLREIHPEVLIVFITAHEEYIREANQVNADGYIMKPYQPEMLEQMAERMKLISRRMKKELFIQTFGRFSVLKNNMPIKINGKSKEILALLVTQRGREISNEEIYSTLWEDRPYGNVEMKVYYNAVRRLKDTLARESISDLLQSSSRGQRINTQMFDCDYYQWQDGNADQEGRFRGEFLSEYSWGEYYLAGLLDHEATE